MRHARSTTVHSSSEIPIRDGKLAGWSVPGALARADNAEAAFVKIMLNKGYSCDRSSLKQDRHEHWDFEFNHSNPHPRITVPFKVDVKARKRFRWLSNQPQDDYVCIEFLNTKGKPGWLYGKADYIAFERKHDFVVVPTKTLKFIVKQIVTTRHDDLEHDKNHPDNVCQPYHFMRRQGKLDLYYWIETNKLFEFDYATLEKLS